MPSATPVQYSQLGAGQFVELICSRERKRWFPESRGLSSFAFAGRTSTRKQTSAMGRNLFWYNCRPQPLDGTLHSSNHMPYDMFVGCDLSPTCPVSWFLYSNFAVVKVSPHRDKKYHVRIRSLSNCSTQFLPMEEVSFPVLVSPASAKKGDLCLQGNSMNERNVCGWRAGYRRPLHQAEQMSSRNLSRSQHDDGGSKTGFKNKNRSSTV